MTHCIVYYTDDKSLLIERVQDVDLSDDDGGVVIGARVTKLFQVQDISDEGLPVISSKSYAGFIVFLSEGKNKCQKILLEMRNIKELDEMLTHGRLMAKSKTRGADKKLKSIMKDLTNDIDKNPITASTSKVSDSTAQLQVQKTKPFKKIKAAAEKKVTRTTKKSKSQKPESEGQDRDKKLEALSRNLEASRLQEDLMAWSSMSTASQSTDATARSTDATATRDLQSTIVPSPSGTCTTAAETTNTTNPHTTNTTAIHSNNTKTIHNTNNTAIHSTNNTDLQSTNTNIPHSTNTTAMHNTNTTAIQSTNNTDLQSTNTNIPHSTNTTAMHNTNNTAIHSTNNTDLQSTNTNIPHSTNTTAMHNTNTTAIHSTNNTDLQSTNTNIPHSTNTTAMHNTNTTAIHSTNNTDLQSTNTNIPHSTNTTAMHNTNTTAIHSTNNTDLQSTNTNIPHSTNTTAMHNTNTTAIHSTNNTDLQSTNTTAMHITNTTAYNTNTTHIHSINTSAPRSTNYNTTANNTPPVTPVRRSLPYLEDFGAPSSVVGNSLSMLYGSPGHEANPCQTGNCCHHCYQFSSLITELQHNLQYLQMELNHLKVQQSQNSLLTSPQVSNSASSTLSMPTNEPSASLVEESPAATELFNGYSKEQLVCKIQGTKDFGKATKLLFRLMYNEKEVVGCTATGFGGKRPICQKKKQVLCDIVQEKFCPVSQSAINRKLGDLLKPSSLYNKDK